MFGKPRRGVRKELEAEGARAQAEVLAIAKRGISLTTNGNVAGAEAALKTHLRVQPTDGSPSFEVDREFRYSQFAIPNVGDKVTVLYDPDDHDHIMLDPKASFISGRTVNITMGGPAAGQPGGDDINALLSQIATAQQSAGGDPDALARQLQQQFGGNVVVTHGDISAFGAPPTGAPGAPASGAAPAPDAAADPLDRIAKLGALKQQGLLTDAEFETQKAKILREM